MRTAPPDVKVTRIVGGMTRVLPITIFSNLWSDFSTKAEAVQVFEAIKQFYPDFDGQLFDDDPKDINYVYPDDPDGTNPRTWAIHGTLTDPASSKKTLFDGMAGYLFDQKLSSNPSSTLKIRVIETEVETEITDQFPGVQQVAELHWA